MPINDGSYADGRLNSMAVSGNLLGWGGHTMLTSNLIVARTQLDLTDTAILTPGGPANNIVWAQWASAMGANMVLYAFMFQENMVGGSGTFTAQMGSNVGTNNNWLVSHSFTVTFFDGVGEQIADLGTGLVNGGVRIFQPNQGVINFGVRVDGSGYTGPCTAGTLTLGVVFLPLGVLEPQGPIGP